jgi:hypothetical protein
MLLVGAAKLSVVVVDVTAELSITCPNPADNEPQGNCEGNALEKELLQNEKYQHQVPLLPGILRNVKYALGGGRKKAQAPPEPDKENSARDFAPGQEAKGIGVLS